MPQKSFDQLFHQPGDAYPAGSEAHTELCEFVPKLAAFRAKQAAARKPPPPSGGTSAAEAAAVTAERLGLPATYDPRYKVNASIVSEAMQGVRAALAPQKPFST